MNGKTLLAALVASIVFFLGGWLIYGMLLESYFASNTNEFPGLMRGDEALIWGYAIGSIMQGILLVFVLGGMGAKSAGRGFGVAAIVGLLISAAHNFYMHASMNLHDGMAVLFVGILVSAVFFGVVGAITGWMLGIGSQSPAEPAAG